MTEAVAIGGGIGVLAVVFAAIYLHLRRKASRLTGSEFHLWFQKAVMGMTGHELRELPDRQSLKKSANRADMAALR
jgi:hypothetical protein